MVVKKLDVIAPRLSSSDVDNEVVLVGSTAGERVVEACDEDTSKSVLVDKTMSKLELSVVLAPTDLIDDTTTGDDDTLLIICDNEAELVARLGTNVDDGCPVIDVIASVDAEVCGTTELTRVGVAATELNIPSDKDKDDCTELDSTVIELMNASKPVVLLEAPDEGATTNADVVIGNGVGNVLLVSNVVKSSVVVLIRIDCD